MRRLTLDSPQALSVVDVADPEPGAGEVLCAVEVAGVCGTDLDLWAGRDPLPTGHVLGHDAVVRVVDHGPGVDDGTPAPGTRAVIDPVDGCRTCVNCRDGRRHLCTATTYMGINAPGCFQDLLVVPAARVHPVPDEMPDDAAALLEPVAVGLHAYDRLHGHVSGGVAVVVGCGPVGLGCGLVLSRHGFDWFGIDIRQDRRAAAEQMGAVASFAPDEESALRQRLGSRATAIVECSGASDAPSWCTDVAPPGSAIAVVAGSPSGYPAAPVLRRELAILGIRGGTRYPEAVALAACLQPSMAGLVTLRCSVDEAPEGFRTLADGRHGDLRLHIDFAGTA